MGDSPRKRNLLYPELDEKQQKAARAREAILGKGRDGRLKRTPEPEPKVLEHNGMRFALPGRKGTPSEGEWILDGKGGARRWLSPRGSSAIHVIVEEVVSAE